MERRFLSTDMANSEIRVDEDGISHIVGYASVFFREGSPGTEYQIGRNWFERIAPSAFDRAAKEDDVRGLRNHEADALLGRTKSGTMTLKADSKGLFYDIKSDPDSGIHRDTIAALKRKDLDGSSFAFTVKKESYEDLEDGRTIRTIEEIETLYDVGPVTYPAYTDATSGVRSADVESASTGFKAHEERKQSQSEKEENDKIQLAQSQRKRQIELHKLRIV